MYRGLWEIEENFKLTKSYLSTRPVYVRKESSIRAHFMTCFIALLMVRLLERRTSHALNHSEIVKALQSAMAAEVDERDLQEHGQLEGHGCDGQGPWP